MRGGPSISVSSTVAGGEEHGSPTRAVTFVDERYGSEGLATIRWMGECGNPPDRRVPRPFGLAHTRAADEASGDVRQSRRASNSGAATQTIAPRSPRLGWRGTMLDPHHPAANGMVRLGGPVERYLRP